MIYAENKQGGKLLATPEAEGFCPLCQGVLTPKCGRVKVWHWSHKARPDCDSWAEGETEWHSNWKMMNFPQDWCEKTIDNVFGRHRADVLIPNGGVIEFQKSAISLDELSDREEFYGNMIWVLDGSDFRSRLYRRKKLERGGQCAYRWSHPRMTWKSATKPVYIDMGAFLILISSWGTNPSYSQEWGISEETIIYGNFVGRTEFIRTVATPKFWGMK